MGEIPVHYPVLEPSEVPNGVISGDSDLLTMYGLHQTYDAFVKPYQPGSQSSGENGEPKRNKMESSFKLLVQDLPGRNTISKKDATIPKIRDLIFDNEFQPVQIAGDSIDHATLVDAFGRLPPGSIPNFDSSVFTGRDDDDDRRKKKKKKRRREEDEDGTGANAGIANGASSDKKARIDDRALTVPAQMQASRQSPHPSMGSVRGTSS